MKKEGKRNSEKQALTKVSVNVLVILSSKSCDLHELGTLLVNDKFIAQERMTTIVEGLLKGKRQQAYEILEAVDAQLKHDPSKFKKILKVLDQDEFPQLQATKGRMEGM